MTSGGSVGDGYGPMIVATRALSQLDEVKRNKIAVPGTLTTAYLALNLFAPEIETEVVPFDQIIPQILAGKYEAGLIIHEGQLTYESRACIAWSISVSGGRNDRPAFAAGWQRDPPRTRPGTDGNVQHALRNSIQYALDHREEALATRCSSPAIWTPQLADKFVGMYVNERTARLRAGWSGSRAPPARHGPQGRNHPTRSAKWICDGLGF